MLVTLGSIRMRNGVLMETFVRPAGFTTDELIRTPGDPDMTIDRSLLDYIFPKPEGAVRAWVQGEGQRVG
jgi:hypothetical protein